MARILHRDVSLFNLLFTVLNNKKLLDDILQNLPGAQSESHMALQDLIDKWRPRQGLLGDWGYGVPTTDHPDLSMSDVSPPTTDDTPASTCGPDHSPTLPIQPSMESSFDLVPLKHGDSITFVLWNELNSTDDIDIPVANDPLPETMYGSNDKLHRTVCFFLSFSSVAVLTHTRELGLGWPRNSVTLALVNPWNTNPCTT